MSTIELVLRGGRTALVDSDDIARVLRFGTRWGIVTHGSQVYAAHPHRNPNQMLLHRFVMAAPKGSLVSALAQGIISRLREDKKEIERLRGEIEEWRKRCERFRNL